MKKTLSIIPSGIKLKKRKKKEKETERERWRMRATHEGDKTNKGRGIEI